MSWIPMSEELRRFGYYSQRLVCDLGYRHSGTHHALTEGGTWTWDDTGIHVDRRKTV